MRIKRIEVTGLFDIFNHAIPLNLSERITILHGPNGVGKTMLLRMVDNFFKGDFRLFLRIPFADFTIEFEDGTRIGLLKSDSQTDGPGASVELAVEYTDSTGHRELHQITSPRAANSRTRRRISRSLSREQNLLAEIVEDAAPHLARIGPGTWVDEHTGEHLDTNEVNRYLGYPIEDTSLESQPDWLREAQRSVNVRFLEAQRLFIKPQEWSEKPDMISAVAKYSEELATSIKSTLAAYATLSQSLDRSFPMRLVDRSGQAHIGDVQLQEKLNQLEDKRGNLVAAGLLDEQQTNVQIPQVITDESKSVLSVYVEDVEKKLAVFDELAVKLDLLQRGINQRFRYKRLAIDQNEGFVFYTIHGSPLSLQALSSGEQHEMVLLYEMLFKVSPDSLFLIDEPELSLHLAWQVEFLTDLQEVANLVPFDVIVATHSPQVINARWDLTVQLEGPNG